MKKTISISGKASMLSIVLKLIYGTNKIIVKGKENYNLFLVFKYYSFNNCYMYFKDLK